MQSEQQSRSTHAERAALTCPIWATSCLLRNKGSSPFGILCWCSSCVLKNGIRLANISIDNMLHKNVQLRFWAWALETQETLV
eukprot:1161360-Pelagomonas_calceolata.AAC.8